MIYDGACKFCNGTLRFILKRDRHRVFSYAWLQTETGRRLAAAHGASPSDDFIMLVLDGKLYDRSDAVLQILRKLGRGWQFFYLLHFIPKSFRDAVYHIIAKNRYRWFGRTETCEIPDQKYLDRFLE